jgi:hypothetical protein
MPAALYTKGLQKIQDGTINLETDTIKAVDRHHRLRPAGHRGDERRADRPHDRHARPDHQRPRLVGGVLGNTNANGVWQVTNVTGTTFSLQGSTGNAAYTSGGYVIKLDADQWISDIPSGARSTFSAALTSKAWTPGATGVIFDSADTTLDGGRGVRFGAAREGVGAVRGHGHDDHVRADLDLGPQGGRLGVLGHPERRRHQPRRRPRTPRTASSGTTRTRARRSRERAGGVRSGRRSSRRSRTG